MALRNRCIDRRECDVCWLVCILQNGKRRVGCDALVSDQREISTCWSYGALYFKVYRVTWKRCAAYRIGKEEACAVQVWKAGATAVELYLRDVDWCAVVRNREAVNDLSARLARRQSHYFSVCLDYWWLVSCCILYRDLLIYEAYVARSIRVRSRNQVVACCRERNKIFPVVVAREVDRKWRRRNYTTETVHKKEQVGKIHVILIAKVVHLNGDYARYARGANRNRKLAAANDRHNRIHVVRNRHDQLQACRCVRNVTRCILLEDRNRARARAPVYIY